MHPARWELVAPLLEQALDLAPEQRTAFLDEACRAEPALRADVEALLALDPRPGLVPPGAATFAHQLDRALTAEEPGARVGPYRLEERIGAGGMGDVWRARRVDGFAQVEGLEQTVAVKLIKLGMDTSEMLRRFANERAVLAGLQHDGIARLYDGGADARGRPYLAMEFVDGAPIDRWCAESDLAIAARVDLLARVSDAVAFAHARGVVHRDLKPSNVLVTRDGRPKLLDFGIAKVLAGDPDDAARTRTGESVLTPAYASPEQMRGEPATPRSDVYALGLVLWEVLVGERVFAGDRHVGDEPTRPSAALARRTGSRRHGRRLSGDLDTIVAAACHPDPARRYPTADSLAADLRRHLADLPVRARPDSTAYRVAKFTRRNRALVVSLAAIFLVLVTATALSTRAYVDAAAARDRELEQREIAQRRFDETRGLATRFLLDVHQSIQDLPGATEAREKLLATAADVLDRLAEGEGERRDLDEEIFEAYVRLAQARSAFGSANLGNTQAAMTALEKAGRIALRFEPVRRGRAVADVEYRRGETDFAERRYPQAEDRYLAIVEVLRALPRSAVTDATWRDLGNAALRLAQVTRLQGRRAEAICWLDVVAESRAADASADRSQRLYDRAVVAQERSELAEASEDLASAVEHRLVAVAAMETLAEANPGSAGFRARLASLLASLSPQLQALGRDEQAAETARRAADVLRENALTDPFDRNASEQLRHGLHSLGRVELALRRPLAARDAFAELVAEGAARRAVAPSEPQATWDIARGRAMECVSELAAGNWLRALELAEEALAALDDASLALSDFRISRPSYEIEIANRISRALRSSAVPPELAQAARDLAVRALHSGKARIAAFEPSAAEAKGHRSLVVLAAKLERDLVDPASSAVAR